MVSAVTGTGMGKLIDLAILLLSSKPINFSPKQYSSAMQHPTRCQPSLPMNAQPYLKCTYGVGIYCMSL